MRDVKKGMHEYSPNSIFPQIHFTETDLTELSITTIFIFPPHHITLCLYFQITMYPNIYSSESLFENFHITKTPFDPICMYPNYHLSSFLYFQITISPNIIPISPNCHVTE